MKTGDGFTENVNIDPLINQDAINKVKGLVSEAVDRGAKVLMGGSAVTTAGEQFFEPTILTEVMDKMAIFSNEIFGPVALLFRFKTEEEAVALANDTPFWLAAYFYTQNIGRIWRVGEALEYGLVGINEGLISSEIASFGGMKELGSGREGSKCGIDEYVEIKYLCMGGLA